MGRSLLIKALLVGLHAGVLPRVLQDLEPACVLRAAGIALQVRAGGKGKGGLGAFGKGAKREGGEKALLVYWRDKAWPRLCAAVACAFLWVGLAQAGAHAC